MQLHFQTESNWQCDIAVFFVFENVNIDETEKHYKKLFDQASYASIAPGWRDFKAKAKEHIILYGHKDNAVSRVCAVGLGKKDKCKLETIREAFAAAVKECKKLKLERIGLDLAFLEYLSPCEHLFSNLEDKKVTADYLLEEVCIAGLSSLYTFDKYKSKKDEDEEDNTFEPRSLELLCDKSHVTKELEKAAHIAQASYAGIALSRDLSNMPANELTPVAFAKQAQDIAAQYGFKYSCLDETRMQELNMEAFVGVGQGSSNPPRLAILEYTPKEVKHDKSYVFVGKGITFDSGGISLKPSAGMGEMKTDMSGAADVLGLFKTLGELTKGSFVPKPDRPIIGLLACAENMPDGKALKPGDIVKTYKGKTVEISNTDAEGRLVLIDALAYAQDKYKAEYLIDIATLTGACVVALGAESAGLFSNNGPLAHHLLNSAERVGERIWRMPLWEHMLKKIESSVADIENAGPRDGGAITAAVFLQQFVDEKQAWAHLDIAGPNFASVATALCPKGATGFGTRILIDFVLNY